MHREIIVDFLITVDASGLQSDYTDPHPVQIPPSHTRDYIGTLATQREDPESTRPQSWIILGTSAKGSSIDEVTQLNHYWYISISTGGSRRDGIVLRKCRGLEDMYRWPEARHRRFSQTVS